MAAKDAWKQLLYPALEKEFKKSHKFKVDETYIKVFGENLKQLLLSAPLGEKRVMLSTRVLKLVTKWFAWMKRENYSTTKPFILIHQKMRAKKAMQKISTLASAYKIEAIAIGDRTAGRETEAFIQRIHFDRKIFSYLVNENGAFIYSASKVARDEFPDYDITVRGSVSIGRRLMNDAKNELLNAGTDWRKKKKAFSFDDTVNR